MSSHQPEDNLWTKAETAAYFGVSTRAIDKWCARRILPFRPLPCGKRFEPAKMKAFRAHEFERSAHDEVNRDRTLPA